MPLKITSNTKGFQLIWTSPDEGMEASWKILSSDDEESQLDKMEKALRFVRTQRGEIAVKVEEIKDFLRTDSPAGERIPMGPAVPSDLPAGGLPVNGWAAMGQGRTLSDAHKAAGWEMIPPDQQ